VVNTRCEYVDAGSVNVGGDPIPTDYVAVRCPLSNPQAGDLLNPANQNDGRHVLESADGQKFGLIIRGLGQLRRLWLSGGRRRARDQRRALVVALVGVVVAADAVARSRARGRSRADVRRSCAVGRARARRHRRFASSLAIASSSSTPGDVGQAAGAGEGSGEEDQPDAEPRRTPERPGRGRVREELLAVSVGGDAAHEACSRGW